MTTTTIEITNGVTAPSLSHHDFLQDLANEALAHRALSHPWLRAIGEARFPDMEATIRDFALHYHGYSSWFPRYLETTISRLEREDHRELLRENLAEEKGHLDDDARKELEAVGIPAHTVDGVSHPALFRRFCAAIGISGQELADVRGKSNSWRTRFLHYLADASPVAAVGALGLGTESIVKPVYERIVAGLRQIPSLRRPDYVFFELHCLVDEQHQLDLLNVAASLATTPESRNELRRGMLTALELRCELWDFLHARASKQSRRLYA